mmetsp:Transcript_3507/g.5702  ORF Transcript_3507/g.5702 Transcript_3507/m.5702 type:complete len:242 (+) Transcript_3507:1509-2234(+)
MKRFTPLYFHLCSETCFFTQDPTTRALLQPSGLTYGLSLYPVHSFFQLGLNQSQPSPAIRIVAFLIGIGELTSRGITEITLQQEIQQHPTAKVHSASSRHWRLATKPCIQAEQECLHFPFTFHLNRFLQSFRQGLDAIGQVFIGCLSKLHFAGSAFLHHASSSIDRVPKEPETWQLLPDHTCHDRSSMYTHSELLRLCLQSQDLFRHLKQTLQAISVAIAVRILLLCYVIRSHTDAADVLF